MSESQYKAFMKRSLWGLAKTMAYAIASAGYARLGYEFVVVWTTAFSVIAAGISFGLSAVLIWANFEMMNDDYRMQLKAVTHAQP